MIRNSFHLAFVLTTTNIIMFFIVPYNMPIKNNSSNIN